MLKVENLKNWEEGINQVVQGDCMELMKPKTTYSLGVMRVIQC